MSHEGFMLVHLVSVHGSFFVASSRRVAAWR